ncbi:MAG: ABC transporter ATP-binding protein [Thermodesulfobacteriota bacterium]
MSKKLVLKDINKNFGSLIAVKDVNLTVDPGEFVCFLGPSGCGKTTLLRIITGFEKQSSGTLMYDNQDISDIIPQKRNFGIVFQSYALFPNMTVAENIAFGLKMRKAPKNLIEDRVEEMLNLMGLTEWKTHYPAQLSGGQQQRVALGRAIAIKPKVLLLDEPLSALDAKIRVRLRVVIKKLQKDLGITMIYVTHDQEEALSMADRVVIMENGDIKQVGTPWDIYRKPQSRFVAEFVGTSNFITGTHQNNTLKLGENQLKIDGINGSKNNKINVAIRPEKIELLTDEEITKDFEPSNLVKVEIEVVTFLGAVVQLTFNIDGTEINVDVIEKRYEELGLTRGDSVNLYFPPDSFHVFAANM